MVVKGRQVEDGKRDRDERSNQPNRPGTGRADVLRIRVRIGKTIQSMSTTPGARRRPSGKRGERKQGWPRAPSSRHGDEGTLVYTRTQM